MIIGIDVSRGNTMYRTGVEEYVFQVLKYVSTQALRYPDVEFILYTRESLITELVSIVPDYVKVKVLKWLPRLFWTQIRLSWEMLIHPPDILFVPGHVFPIIHPKRTVMTIHDIAARHFPDSYNWFERWYSLWSVRIAVKKLWKIIAISSFTREQISIFADSGANRQDAQNISVIPLAYDKAYRVIRDEEKINDILRKYNIKKLFFLSVGRLETKKNTVRIIKAFNILKSEHTQKYKDFQLVLVGGNGHGHKHVLDEVERSVYKDDILLLGYIDNTDLPYIMNGAEVFVFPSLYEGFGIPILEAFASGTPVVTSNKTACLEVAGDSAEFVDPFDPTSIANGIEEAMKGKNIKDGLDRAKEFSWDKTVKDTLNFLFL